MSDDKLTSRAVNLLCSKDISMSDECREVISDMLDRLQPLVLTNQELAKQNKELREDEKFYRSKFFELQQMIERLHSISSS